jgi:hypothetical protein
MLFSVSAAGGRDAGKWSRRRPLADQAKSGAFGTGSWTDTSPPNGCRTATKVAVWELVENPVACDEPRYLERRAVTFGSRMGTC